MDPTPGVASGHLEDLLAAVAARNLRLNNLFQLATGSWQANVTDGLLFWGFGRGTSPHEALARALAVQASQPGAKGPPDPPEVSFQGPKAPRGSRVIATVDLEDLGL